ncbi:MAG: amidohydrolase family protein [Pseudomonadota bacterium]
MINAPEIDSHAHVWDASCTYVAGSRYRPAYTAAIETYLSILDRNRIDRSVLVQPSFLGTDNSYMLRVLSAHRDRLRAIVVVDPSISDDELDDLTAGGVIGLRYNLIGRDPDILSTPDFAALTDRATERGWWIEVHAAGGNWSRVLPAMTGVKLMIDHFGRPSATDCAGFAEILKRAPQRTCIKFSAAYRQRVISIDGVARRLIAHFGAQSCLWGSDWPWTQFEDRMSYADAIGLLDTITTENERLSMRGSAAALSDFAL